MQTEQPLTVEVIEIQEGSAVRVFCSNLGTYKTAYTNVRRTPDFPKVGEKWIIDRKFSNVWTFAAKVNNTNPGNRAGIIASFAGTADQEPPEGWCFCDGRYLPVADFGDLYAQIGDRWGALSGVRVSSIVWGAEDFADLLTVTASGAVAGDMVIFQAVSAGVFPPLAFSAPTGFGATWTELWSTQVPRPRNGLVSAAWWCLVDDDDDDDIVVETDAEGVLLGRAYVIPGGAGIGAVDSQNNLLTGQPVRATATVSTKVGSIVLALGSHTNKNGTASTSSSGWEEQGHESAGPDSRSVAIWASMARPPTDANLGYSATLDTDAEAWLLNLIEITPDGDALAFPVPDLGTLELGPNECPYIISLGDGMIAPPIPDP